MEQNRVDQSQSDSIIPPHKKQFRKSDTGKWAIWRTKNFVISRSFGRRRGSATAEWATDPSHGISLANPFEKNSVIVEAKSATRKEKGKIEKKTALMLLIG